MADIKISLDETLELDTIIKKWSNPSNTINLNGNSDSINITGIKKNIGVLNFQNPGTYTITVNGQDLVVEVINPINVPDGIYNEGNEYESITGGISISNQRSNSGTTSKNSDHIYFSMPKKNSTGTSYSTNNKITFDSISEIKVTFGSSNSPYRHSIALDSIDSDERLGSQEYTFKLPNTTPSKDTKIFDVSNISGDYYVSFGAEGSNDDGGDLLIYSIMFTAE